MLYSLLSFTVSGIWLLLILKDFPEDFKKKQVNWYAYIVVLITIALLIWGGLR
jgi:hypothetical protein